MYRYEILMLTIPEITKDEASTLEFQIDKLINKFKGSIIAFERWGKYRLAYPVRKNDYGVYFLIRFETEDKRSIINDLNTLFSVKFSDIVMRNLVSLLGANQSLEYQKPPSLEDTPKRHISSFLEEKGLLKKGGSKNRGARPETSPSSQRNTEGLVEGLDKQAAAKEPVKPEPEKEKAIENRASKAEQEKSSSELESAIPEKDKPALKEPKEMETKTTREEV